MKILVAVDQNPYSAHAVVEVARLAANTWANVSLLGVQPKSAPVHSGGGSAGGLRASDGPVPQALFNYRNQFLTHFDGSACPYTQADCGEELAEVTKKIYEVQPESKTAKKKLTLRLRIGSTGREILSEAKEEESDLIVLGCDQANGCGWEGGPGLPLKVANEAPCSVLVVKKKKKVKRIICCLDHDRVSQPSLEMINQMVTLHGAQLVIIGLGGHLNLDAAVEKKMDRILRYYHARGIDPLIEMVDVAALDGFIARESRWGMMALWMGPQSILEKVFPRRKVNKLIKGGDASVLILR
jgi:nucleotide-binding universal stress UspA family protein